MMSDEITIEILREIRDSIRTLDSNLSTRIDAVNTNLSARIDHLTERVDVLSDRVTVVEHTLRDASGQLLLLTRYMKNRTEVDIADLRERVTKLETKVG